MKNYILVAALMSSVSAMAQSLPIKFFPNVTQSQIVQKMLPSSVTINSVTVLLGNTRALVQYSVENQNKEVIVDLNKVQDGSGYFVSAFLESAEKSDNTTCGFASAQKLSLEFRMSATGSVNAFMPNLLAASTNDNCHILPEEENISFYSAT